MADNVEKDFSLSIKIETRKVIRKDMPFRYNNPVIRNIRVMIQRQDSSKESYISIKETTNKQRLDDSSFPIAKKKANPLLKYRDGIHEITKKNYVAFYRSIEERITFNRSFEKLFMIKKEEIYMFLMSGKKGKLLLLNGGSAKNVGNHPLEYFYQNLTKYAQTIKDVLARYESHQERIAKEVKILGGDGRIHGCIIDIDFYNHLYLNPLDYSITPYFAITMVDKYVYDNIPSLLKYECPRLYENYESKKHVRTKGEELSIYGRDLPISEARIPVASTEIYRISRLLKGLQFLTRHNIVRLWNDAVIGDAKRSSLPVILDPFRKIMR